VQPRDSKDYVRELGDEEPPPEEEEPGEEVRAHVPTRAPTIDASERPSPLPLLSG
jgi:hypothetical protein